MEIEMLKEKMENENLIFDESELYDDSIMGDKIEDFEILGVNNQQNKSTDFIMKVRSLINHKKYSMRKLDAQNYVNCPNLDNEISRLINLKHSNIIKYYKSIKDSKKNIYLIEEYVDNKDLDGFVEAHRILSKPVDEQEIWNFLLQCLTALAYIHSDSVNIIHKGIRTSNILMNNNQNIKLSYFEFSDRENNLSKLPNISFEELSENKILLSPELLRGEKIDQKHDVFCMGYIIFYMCFFTYPQSLKNIGNEYKLEYQKVKENNNYADSSNVRYSDKLMEIVNLMLNDKNERPTSKEILDKVREEYGKLFNANTSINSVLRCMSSFKIFNEIIFQNANNSICNNKEKNPIGCSYYNALNLLRNFDENKWNNCLNDFRGVLATQNSKLNGSKEISPLFLLGIILERMHNEQNSSITNKKGSDQKEDYIINTQDIDKTNKYQALNKFISYFFDNMRSFTADNFFGTIKTKYICKECRLGTYEFSNFCISIFDLENLKFNKMYFDLMNDGYKYQHENHKEIIKYCERCLSNRNHNLFNQYYIMPSQLIISFFRGTNYEIHTKIEFNEEICFIIKENDKIKRLVESKYSPPLFKLTGSVNRILENGNEKFICFYFDYHQNVWKDNDGRLINDHLNYIKNNGDIILLFYSEDNKKNII